MIGVFAPAALLLAAGAASAQVLAPKLSLPAARAPLPALSASLLSAPSAGLAAPLLTPEMRVLGVPGPGVTPAHIEAVKALARRSGQAIVVHGSRQTGFSHHTGLPFAPDTDLDLGLIGAPEKILDVTRDMWDGRVPHASHGPMITVPSIEDAVGRGHLVIAPAPARLAGGARRTPAPRPSLAHGRAALQARVETTTQGRGVPLLRDRRR